MLKITFTILAASLLLSSCTAQVRDENAYEQAEPRKFILHSTKPSVLISSPNIGSVDWHLRPDLDVDPLVIECPQTEEMTIVFESDLDRLDIKVSGHDIVFVDIKVDGVAATTLVECTIPSRNYDDGDYSADRITISDFTADLSPILDAYLLDNEPGGILTIWERGELTYEYAIGLKGLDSKETRSVADHFDIASVSKEFTAIAILKLIEEGKLGLDTRLNTFFPELPNAKDITIYHLLAHTHGLPDFMNSDGYDTSKAVNMDEILEIMTTLDADFKPGTNFEYGNMSYFFLAKIGEKITGLSHSDYIREALFKPAGMTDSYFLTDDVPSADRVTGIYQSNGKIREVEKDSHPSHATGIGDVVSTFGDLQKWYKSLSTGKIISSEMFDLAATPKALDNGQPIYRGFGFFADTVTGNRVIYNSGDYYTHTRYIYFIDQDKFVALSTNNPIQHHDYTASDIYLHVVGKMMNRETFSHWGEDIDLSDL